MSVVAYHKWQRDIGREFCLVCRKELSDQNVFQWVQGEDCGVQDADPEVRDANRATRDACGQGT